MNTISIEKCSSCGKSVAAYDGVSTGGSEDSNPLRTYWNDFVFEGYVNHRTEAVYLAGLPDIPESRPHSAVNSWDFRR